MVLTQKVELWIGGTEKFPTESKKHFSQLQYPKHDGENLVEHARKQATRYTTTPAPINV